MARRGPRTSHAKTAGQITHPTTALQGNLETLGRLGTRAPLKLRGMAFDELFAWLSASQSRVSASNPGDAVALPAPTGWAEV